MVVFWGYGAIMSSELPANANIGSYTVEFILSVAELLTHNSAPGWVALGLFCVLILYSTTFLYRIHASVKTIKEFKGIFLKARKETDDNPELETSFKNNYKGMQQDIVSFANEKASKFSALRKKKIKNCWDEYDETLHKEGPVVQNSLRPDLFFNKEDLGLQHSFSKMVPSLFVSLGLFFTFLGLVSALDQASGSLSQGGAQEALSNLLTIATAKFIMSLTGLFCSIIFSIFYKSSMKSIDQNLQSLCIEIEKRVNYHSLENIAEKQLEAIKAQKENFENLGENIVAAIATNIRTIPDAIVQGISPIAESIQNSSTSGVNQMVTDISKQLSGGFENSLAQVGSIVENSAQQLSELTQKLEQSSGNMGSEFERSIEGLNSSMTDLKEMMSQSTEQTVETLNKGSETLLTMMNETLSEIRDNSVKNATLLSEAADKISKASDAFSSKFEASSQQAIQTAETELTSASQKIAANISQEAESFADLMQGKLTAPVQDLKNSLEGLNNQITINTQHIDGHSKALSNNTQTAKTAQDAFAKTVSDLKNISAPIQDSISKTERSTYNLVKSVEEINNGFTDGVAANNQSVLNAFTYFTESSQSYQKAIEQSLEGINQAISQFSSIVHRYDEIDEKLGQAFHHIEEKVQASLKNLNQFSQESQEKHTDAVRLLRTAISDLAPFQPQKSQHR